MLSFKIPDLFSSNLVLVLFLALFSLSTSCSKEDDVSPESLPPIVEMPNDSCLHLTATTKRIEKMVFLGHTYDWTNTVDERLEYLASKKYFQDFDHIWLGGDMCSETTQESATLDYLNCLFDLSHPRTHWAVGNHDVRNGNHHFITNATQRPFSYTSLHGDLAVMVLNTNLYDPECTELDAQNNMIQNVCDTLEVASHLVVLSHHIIWGDADAGIQSINMWDRANANKPFWKSECAPNTKFHQSLYPLFTAVQERGIQVVFIAGDYGQREKKFQYLSEKGIWFIASGIDDSYVEHNGIPLPPDHILELQYDTFDANLSWKFADLDSLVKGR